jgi:hypothetical protein
MADTLYCEDFESVAAADDWNTTGGSMTVEGGALKLDCDPNLADITISTISDKLGVLSYPLTALELSIKTDIPAALQSINVKLTDSNKKTARYALDISKIPSEKYKKFVVPIQDMKQDNGFLADRVETLSIDISSEETVL